MRQQLPILRDYSGLLYVKLARRLEADGGEEVILIEEWRDAASLYGWAGNDISRARLLPGSEDLLLHVSVTHYESLDVVPSDFEMSEADEGDPVRARGPASG